MKQLKSISFVLLLFCGCNRVPLLKGVSIQNSTSHIIFVTSESAHIHEMQIKPYNVGEINHIQGTLLISNDNDYVWYTNDFGFFSKIFNVALEEEPAPPLYIKRERKWFWGRYALSIKVKIENDKFYVMPGDEHKQGLYKQLQPNGFPISGVQTNIEPKVSIPAQ